jgi:hypothetical protein
MNFILQTHPSSGFGRTQVFPSDRAIAIATAALAALSSPLD